MRKHKNKIITLLFCFVISFVVITLFSKCSFLYPFNGWDDFNSFYTVGKSWVHGLIPYRDLFEQKGPLLYLIFMIGYLITPDKFIGIYVLEIFSFTITLYYSSKIIDLFIENNKYGKYLILLLYALIMTTSYSFVYGGSSEEFNLLFVTISVFYILKYFKSNDIVNVSYKDLFINGLCCGLSLMIKYTTIGLWFIFMLCFCINLIRLKKYKKCVVSGLVFILAMLLPLTLFSIYFYLNDAIYDFFNVYFYTALFKYQTDGSVFLNLFMSIKNLVIGIFSNYCLILMLYAIFANCIYKKYRYNFKLNLNKKYLLLFFMFLFSLIILYWGQIFRPYTIIAMYFFMLLIIIYVYKLFYKYRLFKLISIISIIVLVFTGIDYDYMTTSKDKIVQYRFAKIINQYDNPTILQYRTIDEGFYTTSGVLISSKYFEQTNFNYDDLPESFDTQDSLINNKEVTFVIVRKFDLNDNSYSFLLGGIDKEQFNMRFNNPLLDINYEIVDVYKPDNGYYNTCIYYLYKVRD